MATTARRRRTTGRDFVDEEETTTRRRAKDVDDEVEDEVEVEVEDDEEPAPRRSSAKKRAPRAKVEDEPEEEGDEEHEYDSSLIQKGWKEINKHQPKGDWTNDVRIGEDPVIVKFLDDEPFGYNQHWVQREGKKSFPCLGAGCPLCKVGVRVSQKIVYPVVNFGDDGSAPEVQNLTIGIQFARILDGYNEDNKVGPLTRLFWAISKTGKGLKTQYSALPVKERDLEEDWRFDIDEVDDFLANAEAPAPEKAVTRPKKSELQEIASEIME